ncbi:MAG: gliding motility-associated ABC transporter permease subunit GldF, partial [Chlorobi bacterium]|nr:gliding motility-associated ABC transporter permease subunit GldF [Chlorobiota bacterium]
MFTLFRRELNSFFNSLIGYLVIIVFLIANSLFVWIFPGQFNILDSGYANIDTLFIISPWIFMFLVPAVTMRSFSDEIKTGTLELLLSRPITNVQIIVSKYLAAVVIVLFSLLPTLLYFLSVYLLGSPVGNIDTGGTWGSFIGLFFLAITYTSIGVFSSSLSENQIVSFIIAVTLSFIFFIGFDSIASLSVFNHIAHIISYFSINEHYRSISRGVIDTRDIVYFI